MTAAQTKTMDDSVRRFSTIQRAQHLLMLTTFTGLALTGLPQKFSTQGWAIAMLNLFGGIEFVRIVHRVFATGLMLGVIVHLIDTLYRLLVMRGRPEMLPRISDATDLVKVVANNLGLRVERPRMPRFNYEEKMEYWAFVWGTAIMVMTGFMLWNPIATTSLLPGEVIPAAKAAHGAEAILAVIAILTWHFYGVHLRRFNKSMFTGKLERHVMEEEHALELANLETGNIPKPPSAVVYRKRIFLPIAVVLTLLLIAGLIWFVGFETTAIQTIPPYSVPLN
jgi:cytochrome b subunit of formate dehydrogenase